MHHTFRIWKILRNYIELYDTWSWYMKVSLRHWVTISNLLARKPEYCRIHRLNDTTADALAPCAIRTTTWQDGNHLHHRSIDNHVKYCKYDIKFPKTYPARQGLRQGSVIPKAACCYFQVFTISLYWGSSFFHAVIEDMSRAAPYIRFLTQNPEIKIHVNMINSYTKNILNDLGISTGRLVTGVVKARVLYQPMGSRCGYGTFFPLHVLSMLLSRSVVSSTSTRDTIVLIKRSTGRWFNNHGGILKMLQNKAALYNSSVVVYDDRAIPSLETTKKLFNRAFLIVAPHGAGLSNMVFARPGTVILEGLCCGNQLNLCYQALSEILGHRHYGVTRPGGCFRVLPEELQTAVEFTLKIFYDTPVGAIF